MTQHLMACRDITWHSMSWHDVTLHDAACHDMTWHYMKQHDISWHDTTWHDMTWHDITWHSMTYHDMTLHDVTWPTSWCCSWGWWGGGTRRRWAAPRPASGSGQEYYLVWSAAECWVFTCNEVLWAGIVISNHWKMITILSMNGFNVTFKTTFVCCFVITFWTWIWNWDAIAKMITILSMN